MSFFFFGKGESKGEYKKSISSVNNVLLSTVFEAQERTLCFELSFNNLFKITRSLDQNKVDDHDVFQLA